MTADLFQMTPAFRMSEPRYNVFVAHYDEAPIGFFLRLDPDQRIPAALYSDDGVLHGPGGVALLWMEERGVEGHILDIVNSLIFSLDCKGGEYAKSVSLEDAIATASAIHQWRESPECREFYEERCAQAEASAQYDDVDLD